MIEKKSLFVTFTLLPEFPLSREHALNKHMESAEVIFLFAVLMSVLRHLNNHKNVKGKIKAVLNHSCNFDRKKR
jgi:hypothetical protein